MKINLVDKMISMVSPAWALNRLAARAGIEYYSRFEINDPNDRLRRMRAKSRGPVTELRESRAGNLNTARHLDRRNSWTAGVLTAIATNIIGSGIELESKMKDGSGRAIDDLNDAITGEQSGIFTEWAKGPDLNGEMGFGDIQHQLEREMWAAGEVLLGGSFVFDLSRPSPVPLVLEIIEAERLDSKTEKLASGNSVIQGIEFDQLGRRVAYWIFPTHPNDSLTGSFKSIRIPADRILHLYAKADDRPNMIRGLTKLTPVANCLEALNSYLDKELTKAEIAASFALMIKRGGLGPVTFPIQTNSESDTKDDMNNPIANLEGGMIYAGGPQDSIEGVGPAVQSTAFEAFVALMLRGVAVGLNVSYEFLARDYTKTNFHSARQSKIEDRKHWRKRQGYHIRRTLPWVLRQFWSAATIAGVDPIAGIPLTKFTHSWRQPGWESVDRIKDATASQLEITSGLSSPQIEAAARGRDFYAVVDEIAAALLYAKSKGVPLGKVAGPPPGSHPPSDGSKDKEKSPPADGEGKGKPPPAADKKGISPVDKDKNPRTGELKDAVNSYGAAVRAGVITPQPDDEDHFRDALGLPPPSPEVAAAWEEDGGTRRPVTLKAKGEESAGESANDLEDEQ